MSSDRAKAKNESAKGNLQNFGEKMAAGWDDTKANVKEAFGGDGTSDRLKADQHRIEGEKKKNEHEIKSTAYDAKAKGKELVNDAKEGGTATKDRMNAQA